VENKKLKFAAQAESFNWKLLFKHTWPGYLICMVYMMTDFFHRDWEGILGGVVLCAVFFIVHFSWMLRINRDISQAKRTE
jgi:MFS superfamily sulfate permease-like transporter